jgi:peptidoglycan hydrolase CwlO-like protein
MRRQATTRSPEGGFVLGKAAIRRAIGFALTCALVLPAAAVGAPADLDSSIAAKQAERTAALAELARKSAELDAQVAAYLEVTRQIDRVQADVDALEVEVAEMDLELGRTQSALTDRAVQLYRGDRAGMVDLLFTAESMRDLVQRLEYLLKVSEHDSRVVTEVRVAKNEKLYIQESLTARLDDLTRLQADAETQRLRIESEVASQQVRARELGTDIAALVREKRRQAEEARRLAEERAAAQAAAAAAGSGPASSGATYSGSAPKAAYSPDTLISDATFRDASSMTAADIQAFLEKRSGVLATLRAPDHQGRIRSAAEMIAEAAVAFRINPKVILVSLQKEQSLLERRNPSQTALDWAMGCGKADSRTYYEYQGFGKQIWWGAQKLDKNAKPYREGMSRTIDGSLVMPSNAATWSLYKYTPHLRGTMSFWLLYWRYFGDPIG